MKELQIGDRLKALRKAKKLTTQEVADKVNIAQSYLSRFENNKAVPNIEMLDRILRALDTDLSSFFSNDIENASPDLIELINTVKTLSPEAQAKLNEFIQLVAKGNDDT